MIILIFSKTPNRTAWLLARKEILEDEEITLFDNKDLIIG